MKFVIGPEIVNSYKRLSYTEWYALAEFIDNSTQAYFNNKKLLDSLFKINNEQLKVVQNEFEGVTIAYALKYSQFLKEWNFVNRERYYNEYRPAKEQ